MDSARFDGLAGIVARWQLKLWGDESAKNLDATRERMETSRLTWRQSRNVPDGAEPGTAAVTFRARTSAEGRDTFAS